MSGTKKIHRLWLGPKPMPRKYIEYGLQLVDMNPGWTVYEWRANDIKEIINKSVWDAIGQTPKSSIPMDRDRAIAVQRADVLGYELIWKHGGIYMNCDIQPLRPFDELIEEVGDDAAFAGYEGVYNGRKFLVNAVLGGPPKHPFWGRCIADLDARYFNGWQRPMEQTTGPWLVTETFEHWNQEDGKFVDLPQHYFNPVHFHQIETGGDASDRVDYAKSLGAYTLHHWGHREDQINYV